MKKGEIETRTVFLTKMLGQYTALLILCLVAAMPSWAQGPAPAEDREEYGSHQVETVVVTAQKREEDMQKVPISMEVFSEFDLEEAAIGDLKELVYHSPNLYAKQNTNQNMIFIRGISSHNVILNTSVGLFVDDINYPMSFMQNPDLIDVEQIEILRGPQGTLHGRNTEAGAIKIVTRQPGQEFSGKVYGETGVYDTPGDNPFFYKSGFSMSGPVVKDNLYLGGAFQIERSDGYTYNVYDGDDEAGKTDHKNGKATLRWTPNDRTDIIFLANGYKNRDGYGHVRYQTGNMATNRYEINWDGGNSWEDKNFGQAFKINYNAKAWDFISITTYNDFDTDFTNDGEFGNMVFPDQVFSFENRTVSQEFRLSSAEGSGTMEWLVGLYGFRDDNDTLAEFFGQSRTTDFQNKGYAVFGQATCTVYDRVHLTAGLRYDHQASEGTQINNNVSEPYSAEFDQSEMLPKATTSVDFTRDAMGYVSVSRGMMAGGFDYAFASDADTLTFDPEFTWNYEVGVKTSWLNNTLQINAALYYIDIKDKQVQEAISASVRKITNAAEAYSQGLELDFQARPVRGLTLFGGLGISDARIGDWVSTEPDGSQYDYNDKKLTYAPEYTFNLGATYNFTAGYFIRTDILGVGDLYTDAKNTQKIDSYATANLTVGYQRDTFGLNIWFKNIFDKEYLTNKSTYINNDTIIEDGAPRTIGVTASYRL